MIKDKASSTERSKLVSEDLCFVTTNCASKLSSNFSDLKSSNCQASVDDLQFRTSSTALAKRRLQIRRSFRISLPNRRTMWSSPLCEHPNAIQSLRYKPLSRIDKATFSIIAELSNWVRRRLSKLVGPPDAIRRAWRISRLNLFRIKLFETNRAPTIAFKNNSLTN